MTNDLQIGQALLATCFDAGHKPGKVQFTKYLYLIDYFACHLEGKKLTNFPWIFYHYGPWCKEVEECMQTIADQSSFGWRENGFTVMREVELSKPDVGFFAKTLIANVVETFKDRDLNILLEVAYSETEPMAVARRGELLDFSLVPFDKRLPAFFRVPSRKCIDFTIHPSLNKRMEEYRTRILTRKKATNDSCTFRQSNDYVTAMELLRSEFSTEDPLHSMTGSMSAEAIESMVAESIHERP